MRAYAVQSAGEQPATHDLEVPEPDRGEVRVRVVAASVNGFDLAVAAGYMAGFFEHRYPVVLGREFAGIVDGIGPDVDTLVIGDRVLGVVSKPHLHDGAFAEYTTAVAESSVVRTPEGMTDAAAAGLGHTGSTALIILASLGDVAGQKILVVGATGGVGTIFTQLAAAMGAEVIATGRTEEGRSLMAELGAAHTVDYADLDAEVRAIAPDGVDAVVHLIGDAASLAPLVRDGGMFVSTLLYAPEMFPDPERLTPAPIAGFPSGDGLRLLTGMVDDGRLRVIIDREVEFDEIGDAFAAYGRETIGNIVVRIG
ncbi:NADP-dependent oxidoreductase [Microbacterium sp. 2FI]|uniref:NADP-dependent oxidoreductase n=1 Tax=Microbacterium sp. 2FI TaxID=2502193 RepID=UPI0010FA2F0A|nr:NADP-dependent oxidoreductase [Microbacterium sp. 2FI]